MAITANSLHGGSISGTVVGAYPAPVVLPMMGEGTGTIFRNGAAVIRHTNGTIALAAEDPILADVMGYVAPVSPRLQDMEPLTSATAPAAALLNRRTTAGAGAPDFADMDDPDFAIPIYPAISGLFVGVHFTDTAANGTDIRANAATDMVISCGITLTVTSGGANSEVNYATAANIWVIAADGDAAITQSDGAFETIAYQNPQPDTAIADAVVIQPGPISQGASGATRQFNPRMIAVASGGAYF